VKHTRRWQFVKQDAIRFAGLGLSDAEIAARLEVDRVTVYRWRKAGKLEVPHGIGARQVVVKPRPQQTPSQWSADVRASYDLDSTDDQTVTNAEAALVISRDPLADPRLQLQAMGTFDRLTKGLKLAVRNAESAAEEPKRQTFALPSRSGGDPRSALAAVK
jgi:hypothetical protein